MANLLKLQHVDVSNAEEKQQANFCWEMVVSRLCGDGIGAARLEFHGFEWFASHLKNRASHCHILGPEIGQRTFDCRWQTIRRECLIFLMRTTANYNWRQNQFRGTEGRDDEPETGEALVFETAAKDSTAVVSVYESFGRFYMFQPLRLIPDNFRRVVSVLVTVDGDVLYNVADGQAFQQSVLEEVAEQRARVLQATLDERKKLLDDFVAKLTDEQRRLLNQHDNNNK